MSDEWKIILGRSGHESVMPWAAYITTPEARPDYYGRSTHREALHAWTLWGLRRKVRRFTKAYDEFRFMGKTELERRIATLENELGIGDDPLLTSQAPD